LQIFFSKWSNKASRRRETSLLGSVADGASENQHSLPRILLF